MHVGGSRALLQDTAYRWGQGYHRSKAAAGWMTANSQAILRVSTFVIFVALGLTCLAVYWNAQVSSWWHAGFTNLRERSSTIRSLLFLRHQIIVALRVALWHFLPFQQPSC